MLNSTFPETNFLVDITNPNSNPESNNVIDSTTVTYYVEFPNYDDDLLQPQGLEGYSSFNFGEWPSQTLDLNQYVAAGNFENLSGMGDVPRTHEEGIKRSKKNEVQRIAFRTKSGVEVMDDGFKWRKYGKKVVKSSPNPRNYYKCSIQGCNVKKRVERESEDPSYVITTYQGVHNHT